MDEARQRGRRELRPSKYFEDFSIGDQYIIPSRTQTSGLFAMFQAASGDNDPIHYDVDFCRERGHEELLAQAFRYDPDRCRCRYVSQRSCQFTDRHDRSHRTVSKTRYRGNTLYPLLEITDLTEQRSTGVITMRKTIHNQEDTWCSRVPSVKPDPEKARSESGCFRQPPSRNSAISCSL
ncbi:MAG: hypothetical protein CM1200mP20_12390 [Pseudomonadota bacterium]|nr:MAG: hypothetical protein CM1200mP20_12390 [Pseudomonadota bacterium]